MTRPSPLDTAAAGTIIAILAALVLAADQFTKYLAIENLPPEEPVQIIGEFLVFYLVRNPGAAFSLGEGVTWIFTIALAAVAVDHRLDLDACTRASGPSCSACCSAGCWAT